MKLRGKRPERRGAEWRGRSIHYDFPSLPPVTSIYLIKDAIVTSISTLSFVGEGERTKTSHPIIFLSSSLSNAVRPTGWLFKGKKRKYLSSSHPQVQNYRRKSRWYFCTFVILGNIRDCAQKRGEMPKWDIGTEKRVSIIVTIPNITSWPLSILIINILLGHLHLAS